MNDNARVKLNRDYICWQSEILTCTELEGARLRQGYARLILISGLLCRSRSRNINLFHLLDVLSEVSCEIDIKTTRITSSGTDVNSDLGDVFTVCEILIWNTPL